MTRCLLNLLGVICTACATVSLMSMVLRVDYGIVEPTTPRPWTDLLVVFVAPLGAAVFFTAANTYKDRK